MDYKLLSPSLLSNFVNCSALLFEKLCSIISVKAEKYGCSRELFYGRIMAGAKNEAKERDSEPRRQADRGQCSKLGELEDRKSLGQGRWRENTVLD